MLWRERWQSCGGSWRSAASRWRTCQLSASRQTRPSSRHAGCCAAVGAVFLSASDAVSSGSARHWIWGRLGRCCVWLVVCTGCQACWNCAVSWAELLLLLLLVPQYMAQLRSMATEMRAAELQLEEAEGARVRQAEDVQQQAGELAELRGVVGALDAERDALHIELDRRAEEAAAAAEGQARDRKRVEEAERALPASEARAASAAGRAGQAEAEVLALRGQVEALMQVGIPFGGWVVGPLRHALLLPPMLWPWICFSCLLQLGLSGFGRWD